jgi:hypothetical protein
MSESVCSSADHQLQASDLLPTGQKPRRLFFWIEKIDWIKKINKDTKGTKDTEE